MPIRMPRAAAVVRRALAERLIIGLAGKGSCRQRWHSRNPQGNWKENQLPQVVL